MKPMIVFFGIWLGSQLNVQAQQPTIYQAHDAHFHLTNYVQNGISIDQHLRNMGDKVGRSTLFGIPLQQVWSAANTGSYAPTYYLATDDPLYYYSFTDAVIATTYLSLPADLKSRFDPMITGFNPADMYAADHIRRVLKTFPGVFSGIGEFTLHKEFVSAKVAGPVATINNPAVDRILDLCAEAGLVAIIHNDIEMPFPKDGQDNWDLAQFGALLKRHPDATIIWAHCGVGRIVRPVVDQVGMLERAFGKPELAHVLIDLSWTETAKYIVGSPEAMDRMAALMNKYPDRFLFGTDEVAPADQQAYLKTLDLYQPLIRKLSPEAREKFLKGNYERVFDRARVKVRSWEQANLQTKTN